MGTQFWWFYDVIALAVLLVCIFLSGKKGFIKGAFTAAACIISVLLASAVSTGISPDIYKSTMKNGNIKKLEKSIGSDTFTDKYADYLESMGYIITVNNSRLKEVLLSDGDIDKALCKYVNNINARAVENDETVLTAKIREGYAVVMSEIVSQPLNKFAGETAADKIRSDSSDIQEIIKLMSDSETIREAAVYIDDNYTSGAYETIFGLFGFILIYIVIFLLVVCSVNSFTRNREIQPQSMSSNIIGGLTGIITGAAMIFAAAVVVRLWAVMGGNEMLFFNNEAADRTYIFRYFYNLTMKI